MNTIRKNRVHCNGGGVAFNNLILAKIANCKAGGVRISMFCTTSEIEGEAVHVKLV